MRDSYALVAYIISLFLEESQYFMEDDDNMCIPPVRRRKMAPSPDTSAVSVPIEDVIQYSSRTRVEALGKTFSVLIFLKYSHF